MCNDEQAQLDEVVETFKNELGGLIVADVEVSFGLEEEEKQAIRVMSSADGCLLACLLSSLFHCDRVKAHATTMQREAAVSAVFDAMGLALEEARSATANDEQEAEEAAVGPVKKKARRGSGSSAGGAADRSMSQFAEVMSKFYTPPHAAASSSPPITPAQWLTDCMVSDEQRAKLVQLRPDPSQPFTLLIADAPCTDRRQTERVMSTPPMLACLHYTSPCCCSSTYRGGR